MSDERKASATFLIDHFSSVHTKTRNRQNATNKKPWIEPNMRTAIGMSNIRLSGTAMNKSMRYDHPSTMAVYLKSLAYFPMAKFRINERAKNRASLGKCEMKRDILEIET